MFKIKLRAQWVPVIQRFLELGEHTLAFAANGLQARGVCMLAFQQFVLPHTDGVECYDCRRFCTTCYYQAGVPADKLMVYGGWTTDKSMRASYIEESKLLTPTELNFYSWLVTD